jgi:holliday junction DNA helicase RuvA
LIIRLRGQLVGKGKDFVVLDVGGVGFKVTVPQRLVRDWDAAGQVVQLHTHLHVRENDLALYGAETEDEMSLFHLLLTVTGVGPKVALSILSEYSPGALRPIIAREDAESLARVPGIGPKTAKKIVFHLRDKMPAEAALMPGDATHEPAWDADLLAALTSLGYSQPEAREAIAALPPGKIEFEKRLRLALRYFAK